MRTIGLSPKLVAPVITGIIVYLLTKLAVPLDPKLEQAIQAISMAAATYLAPPGAVGDGEVLGSDARMPAQAAGVIANDPESDDA